MVENVRKELAAIKSMVVRWKMSYAEWASPEGGNEYLVAEFSEEISRHVVPFVQRMFATNHLTASETQEFLNDCYGQLEELRALIAEVESAQYDKSLHRFLKIMGGAR